MPIIVAHILAGRCVEKKAELIRNLTDTVATTLGAPVESVRIILSEMPKEHYGIGGNTAAELGR